MNDFNLARYRWKNRLLLLFSPSKNDKAYIKQIRDIRENEAEIKDRDLIIFRFFKNSDGYFDNEVIPFEDVKRAYREFQMNEDQFSILLIGKDGGVKMNAQHYMQTDDIFNIIDQMPMRQDEMRKKR